MLTLPDAVELIGRRLYGQTWTGSEYMYAQPRKSPEQIAEERKPLESELAAAEARLPKIKTAIEKTLDRGRNRKLAADRDRLEKHTAHLRTRLTLDHPLNEIVIDAYNAHLRGKTATETLLQAIRGFRLKVHDGRGRELNHSVWSDPKFRYCLDLSIVVNPRSSGEPRRQAARIDRDDFKHWLATVTPLVEPAHERSPEERLREFLRREFAAMKAGPRRPKTALREAACKQIAGISRRMFERVWAAEAPSESRKPGAPRKSRKAG